MALNDLKKMIIFSTLENRRIVDAITKDISIAEHTSASMQIEKCLLDGFLPHDPTVAGIVKAMYGIAPNISLATALFNIFQYLTDCTLMKKQSDPANNVLLARFGCDVSMMAKIPENINATRYELMLVSFESCIQYMESNKQCTALSELDSQICYGKKMLAALKESTDSFDLFILKELWHWICIDFCCLYSISWVYRLMANLVCLEEGLPEQPEYRAKLLRILKDIFG